MYLIIIIFSCSFCKVNNPFLTFSIIFVFSLFKVLYGLIIFNPSNSYGQLRNGTTESSDKLIKIKEDVKFEKISAGEISNLAIDNEGNLWSWGENNKGQLGNGTTTNNSIPALVKADK